MTDLPLKFSFNWTNWPFVEVGDLLSPSLREQLDPSLVSDLKSWCEFMLANFDERDGFVSDEAAISAQREYESLCRRLENADLKFIADSWWRE